MRNKNNIWISFLGQTIYENLNSFWWFCEEKKSLPNQIVLFHALDKKDECKVVLDLFDIIYQKYNTNKKLELLPVVFNEENANDFYKKFKKIIIEYVAKRNELFIDISPTTWSFIPVYIIKIFENYHNKNDRILYIQYTNHNYRKLPYPLIPRKGIVDHYINL